ncbi:hypothetical protein JYU14_04185 [Simkania negevensis]|uniref:TonB C-terminal domain-containing protein n=1 Tax=Simkania negevensis TaxID=83561 RepID=A0ABS3ARB0_9BACT|nr:hypothetical protein [Simkania negevensis]
MEEKRFFIRIVVVVLVAHALLCVMLTWQWKGKASFKAKPTSIVVRTVELTPSRSTPPARRAQKERSTEQKAVSPKPRPPEQTKRSTPPPRVARTVRKEEKIDDDLVKLLKENLTRLESLDDDLSPITREVKLPTTIQPAQTISAPLTQETPSANQHAGYQDELIQRLRLLLRLPEYGNVTVRLTLSRDGSVEQMEIVDAKSTQNKEYIAQKLPAVKFPGFGSHFGTAQQHIFTLTLSNDI